MSLGRIIILSTLIVLSMVFYFNVETAKLQKLYEIETLLQKIVNNQNSVMK
jgi:hypothetical protein